MGSKEDNVRRYEAAMHAVQSGVAARMEADGTHTAPKHLRVGVDSALTTMGALARLLIEKGVITEDEYFASVADAAEAEKASYEEWLTGHYGTTVHLA